MALRRLVLIGAIGMLSACAGTPSAGGASVAPSSAGVSASPGVSSSPGRPSATPGSSCPSDRLTIVVEGGNLVSADQCVHENALVDLTFHPVLGYKWSTVNSSDDSRCKVTSARVDADGTGHATLRAVKSGTVDLAAMLSPIGDPHGPPTRSWHMTLHILPSPLP